MSLKPLIAGMSQGGGGGNYANARHVAETGAPYSTLVAAKDAASAGDLIWVHPGNYTVAANTSILKSGVNWHFDSGAIITQAQTTTAHTIGALHDTIGLTSKITGYGEFVMDCTGRVGAIQISSIVVISIPTTGDYVSLFGLENAVFHFWFNVDAGGGAPGIGGTNVEVIVSGGDSLAALATALYTAIGTQSTNFPGTITDNSGTVTYTHSEQGVLSDVATNNVAAFTVSTLTPGTLAPAIALIKNVTGSSLQIEANLLKVIYPELMPVLSNDECPTVADLIDGTILISCPTILGVGTHTNAITWRNGNASVFSDSIIAGNFALWTAVDAPATGDFYVNANLVTVTGTNEHAYIVPLWSSGTEATVRGACWWDLKLVKGIPASHYYGASMVFYGKEKIYLRAQKLIGNITAADGELYCTADKFSPNANDQTLLQLSSDSDVCIINISVVDLNSKTGFGLGSWNSPNTAKITIGSYISNASGVGATITNGSVVLVNSIIDLTAGTNKTALTSSGATPVIQNCVLIGTGTGKDINATSGSVSVVGGHGSGTNGNFRTSGTVNFLTPV